MKNNKFFYLSTILLCVIFTFYVTNVQANNINSEQIAVDQAQNKKTKYELHHLSTKVKEQNRLIQDLLSKVENQNKVIELLSNNSNKDLITQIEQKNKIISVFINKTEKQISSLQNNLSKLTAQYNSHNNKLNRHSLELTKLQNNLINQIIKLKKEFGEIRILLKEDLDKKISQTSDKIAANKENVQIIYIAVAIISIIFTLIILLLFVYSRKKFKSHYYYIHNLLAKSDGLNEEIIKKLNIYIAEMEKESTARLAEANTKQATNSNNISIEDQHAVVKTIANRISFMEVTLSKMDNSIRGHKQLTKSISQIKDNLRAHGYEMIDMLGKQYNAGMKVIANFVDDDELPAGTQVITSIIKPQINYQGIMIQSAQITVTQNV